MGAGGSSITNGPLMKVGDPSSTGSAAGKSLKCVVVGDHEAGKSSLVC